MKPWIKALGVLACLAAGAFFLAYAHQALQGQDLRMLAHPRVAAATGLLTVLYMALIPVTAMAWTLLLKGLGRDAPVSSTASILATSQFGKYLPGNVAHHVGRVVMARSIGLGVGVVVLSIAYETVLTALACAHVSLLTFLWETPKALGSFDAAEHRGPLAALVTIGALATIAAAPVMAKAVWRMRNKDATAPPPRLYPGILPLASGYLCFVLNFTLVGAGLWIVSNALVPEAAGPYLVLLVGAFAASWLVGFVTPGAPAGLGVREAALVFWLGDSMPDAALVSLILALRIATTLGDLLSLAWGSVALRRLRIGRFAALPPT